MIHDDTVVKKEIDLFFNNENVVFNDDVFLLFHTLYPVKINSIYLTVDNTNVDWVYKVYGLKGFVDKKKQEDVTDISPFFSDFVNEKEAKKINLKDIFLANVLTHKEYLTNKTEEKVSFKLHKANKQTSVKLNPNRLFDADFYFFLKSKTFSTTVNFELKFELEVMLPFMDLTKSHDRFIETLID